MDLSIAQMQAGMAQDPSSSAKARMPRGGLSGWFDKPVPANVTDPDAYRAARGFEAHFAQQLVSKLQGSTPLIGGDGPGAEIYNGMFTEMLGDEIAGEGALGITDLVYRDMMKQRGEDPYTDGDIRPSKAMMRLPQHTPVPVAQATRPQQHVLHEPSEKLLNIVDSTAEKYGVDKELVRTVIRAESGWNPYAVSSAGARGLMQLMPGTADSLGVRNSFDPASNIDGGVRYLKQMLDRHDGDVKLALASYNAGPTAVDEHGGIPPFEETQKYVSKIIGWLTGQEVPEDEETTTPLDKLAEETLATARGAVTGPASLIALPGGSQSLLRTARDYLADSGRTAEPPSNPDEEG